MLSRGCGGYFTLPFNHNFFRIDGASEQIHESRKKEWDTVCQHDFVSFFFVITKENCARHSRECCEYRNRPETATKLNFDQGSTGLRLKLNGGRYKIFSQIIKKLLNLKKRVPYDSINYDNLRIKRTEIFEEIKFEINAKSKLNQLTRHFFTWWWTWYSKRPTSFHERKTIYSYLCSPNVLLLWMNIAKIFQQSFHLFDQQLPKIFLSKFDK